MMTVNEVSKLSGVSVRTLHHYDSIGLLKPASVTEAGYRLYGDAQLERLHLILAFREIGFPLKEIQAIAGDAASSSKYSDEAAGEIANFFMILCPFYDF